MAAGDAVIAGEGRAEGKPDRPRYAAWHALILFVLSALFYLACCLRYGVYLGADSRGYIEMISAREPVYPLLLLVFRHVFGTRYLEAVIFFQNLLMACAVWRFVTYLWRNHRLPAWSAYAMLAVHVGVECLTLYASERSAAYPNTIMTEGICLSLYLFYLVLVWRVLEEETRWQPVLEACLLAALMTDTRKQMAVAYLLLVAALVLGRIGRVRGRAYWRRVLLGLAGCVVSVALALLGTRLYNYVLRGSFVQNTRDMNLVLTTTLYVSDPADAERILDDAARDLFQRTMAALDESGSNMRYAGDGWSALEAHYEEHYDVITIDTTGQLFIDDAVERGYAPGIAAEQEADRMSAVIVRSLLPVNLGRYLRVYVANALHGLVNTVAARSRQMDVLALVAYIGYALLMAAHLAHRRTRALGEMSLVVLLSILVNVGVTAALIFCQSRYMIYNMAPFYAAGLAMVADALAQRRQA